MRDAAPFIAAFLSEAPLNAGNAELAARTPEMMRDRFERMLEAFPNATSDEIIRGVRIAAELISVRGDEIAQEAREMVKRLSPESDGSGQV